MQEIVNYLVDMIGGLGYIGIFLLMFLESSFFPFPSEVVMIPAGYLAYKGEMDIYLVIISGVSGSLVGAWFNYLLAHKFGRNFLLKILNEEKVKKLDNFFEKHGHISTFTGRLLPGIRQYISFPAGLAKMDKVKFTTYTTFGALIWIVILTLLGYFIGENQELIHQYLKEITIIVFILISILILFYVKVKNKILNFFKRLILIIIFIFIGWFGYLYIYGNFHKVSNDVYRSAQLNPFNMSYYLKKVKIKSILNLRGETDNDWYKNELFISKEYNITHYDYGISDRRIVTIKQINDILNIIKKAPKPILIHCKAGADRTSLVSAAYLYSISHNYKKAKQQLSFFYGHFPRHTLNFINY